MSTNSPITDAPLGLDPWQLCETAAEPARAALRETLFALGNGRIGVRGAHEEGRLWPGTEQDAIYINGFHDSHAIRYPENAYGLARENQFIVAVPNGKALVWRIDDEAFDPTRGRIEQYRRSVDFRSGVLTREFVWTSPRGRRVAVASRRVVPFARPELYAIEVAFTPLDGRARIVVESSLDARTQDLPGSDDPRVGTAEAASALQWRGVERDGDRITLLHRTRRSGLHLASAIVHDVPGPVGDPVARAPCGGDDCPGLRFSVELAAAETFRFGKFCALVDSRTADRAEPTAIDAVLSTRAAAVLDAARRDGFDAICAEQARVLDRFWGDADVEVDGDPAAQQGLRFNLLHLLQSAGRDGRTNIAAKGVTGSGYDGHYFWDTEIYMIPVLQHTRPDVARQLLVFRHHTLDAARARARELDHPRGALFPWRTITGTECSAFFPAGTAQYHLNADIAHAVRRYWEATGDDAFIVECGAELVIETARVWTSLGHFSDGRFRIHTVTGPDEYTALVDNNFYTNAMARRHLRFAAELAGWMASRHASAWQRLAAAIGFTPDEPRQWQAAADAMLLPYDARLGIHAQDDSFLAKPRWEAADIPADKHPLLLHYHSLAIYRRQVCKQPDVLLALLLLDDEFDAADKRRAFDYYEPLTTHDSSLSRCIFGIVAAEVGEYAKASRYFSDSVRADLDDHHGNTRHGVHTAAMAGSWLGVVSGFAGLRMRRGEAWFAPRLPEAWTRCAFRLRLGDARLEVAFDREGTRYRLLEGEVLRVRHHGEPLELRADAPLAIRAHVRAGDATTGPATDLDSSDVAHS